MKQDLVSKQNKKQKQKNPNHIKTNKPKKKPNKQKNQTKPTTKKPKTKEFLATTLEGQVNNLCNFY